MEEFAEPGESPKIEVGDEVEVFLDRVENARGEASISRDKARREEAWDRLEKAYADEERVEGAIFGRVKGGFTVDLGGAVAFLPENITEYGAFVDLGGVDGLLHVTDMAWRRVNDPREILTIGETVKVQVIKINKETHRISLGMKQLQDDPWGEVAAKYALDSTHQGRVTNITDYGAFVELEPGVEGLVHVSEMSWTKKNVHPGKIVSTSQEVEVMVHLSDITWDGRGEHALGDFRKGDMVKAVVTEVDVEKERISLSIKALDGSFDTAVDGVKRGSIITVEVTSIEDGGVEVEYEGAKSWAESSHESPRREVAFASADLHKT